jgi:hypothetical protein
MTNVKGFEKIASKQWNPDLMIRESDSDVYKLWNKCYKHYFWLDKRTIEEYHMFQNWLSLKPVTIDLNKPEEEIFPISSNIFSYIIWSENIHKINSIEFYALDIGDSISQSTDTTTKEKIIVSKIKYIEWKTLFDICYENQNDFELQMNIYNILVKINQLFQWDMSNSNPMDKFQIHWINCKITWCINGILYITITDIARNIQELVDNNKERIQSLLNKKR